MIIPELLALDLTEQLLLSWLVDTVRNDNNHTIRKQKQFLNKSIK